MTPPGLAAAHADLALTLEALARRRWKAVLLQAQGKKPAADVEGHWIVTREPDVVERHFGAGRNVGLLTHEETGLIVLDEDDAELFAAMERTLGPLGLPWVRTGSAKRHYYCGWTPGLPAKLRWQGRKAGEIQRGPGLQQVVAPPSRHPLTGVPYVWLVDPVHEPLLPMPERWRSHLMSSAATSAPPASRIPIAMRPPPTAPTERAVAALAQPGARMRATGHIKFQCPACAQEGHDRHHDNAVLFPDGRWGCAYATGPEGRRHRRAIGTALGALRPLRSGRLP